MEETVQEAPPTDDWRGTLTRTIDEQRRRVSERIASQRERLRELETRIAAQLEDATQALSREQAQRETEIATRQQAVTEREQRTEQQRRHVAQQLRAQRKELTAEIELQRAGARAAESEQEQQLQVRLAELQGKYDRLREELELRQQQRDEAQHKLGELMGQLDARTQESQRQVTELQRRLDESQAELVRRTAEAEQLRAESTRLAGEVERTRKEAQQQIKDLQATQGKSDDEKLRSFEKQLEDARTRLDAERTAWDSERQQLKADLAAATRSGAEAGAATLELTRLRQENQQLENRVADALAKAKSGGGGESSQEMDDLRRRFEMAVQDVRELKTKNAELTDQLARARQNAGSAAAGGGGGSDWESLKQRMLAQLESDFDADEQSKQDKLTVEGTIKITDQVVAEKDNEIAELRRLLESQSQNMGEMAVGASAIAQVLDTDELVRQERENLKQLQEQLREELRKAEIDNSLERAKLARERAEVEERLRQWEEQGGKAAANDRTADGKKQPATRGKWLARLGLHGKDG